MLAIFMLVAPVFGLIAIGWCANRVRYIPEAAGPLLSEFAFKILIPALLFRAMATMAPVGVTTTPNDFPWLETTRNLLAVVGAATILVQCLRLIR